jgi:hypothetical protein
MLVIDQRHPCHDFSLFCLTEYASLQESYLASTELRGAFSV